MREASKTHKITEARQEIDDKVFDELCLSSSHPEFAFLKPAYRGMLRDAFREALGTLNERDKTLLRLSVHKKLKAQQIGRMFGVRRETIARWLSAIRAQLFTETRRQMCERTKATEFEMDSILRLISSQLDASFSILQENGQTTGNPMEP